MLGVLGDVTTEFIPLLLRCLLRTRARSYWNLTSALLDQGKGQYKEQNSFSIPLVCQSCNLEMFFLFLLPYSHDVVKYVCGGYVD